MFFAAEGAGCDGDGTSAGDVFGVEVGGGVVDEGVFKGSAGCKRL